MQHTTVNKHQKFPLPHPIEWIVSAMMVPTHYEKIAQFKHRSHALMFQKSITCFHTMIVSPAIKEGIAR